MKRILLIAYHFPPLAGSSGIQRALRLAQHLPRLGWEVSVLSCQPRAYESTSADLLGDIPAGVHVERAFALDSARHLAIAGRHWGALARPDRWASWRFDAVRRGKAMLARQPHQAIWSTFPIATAHVIGRALAQHSGLPWVADFRDPMVQADYPSDPQARARLAGLERDIAAAACCLTVTTPGAQRAYLDRYPGTRVELLQNGYDEESFANAESPAQPLNDGVLTLLHSGIVYPSERDPSQLLEALALLKAEGLGARLRLRLRAPVHGALVERLAQQQGVAEMIEILPPVGYRAALQEMRQADGLLVMQAANCNEQVPAKVYEYLRAGPPLLSLADPAGDTAAVLRAAGIEDQAPLDDTQAIAALLRRFVADDPALRLRPRSEAVAGASRWARSQQLVQWLDSL